MLSELTQNQIESMIRDAREKELRMWRSLILSESSSITCTHRADILEWMLQVCSQFSYYPEAYSLAVSILDKFLSLVKLQPKYLKCLALTCVHIAAKITEEDEVVPHISDLVYLTSVNCTETDVARMEMIILNKLQWDVNLPTPLHFLQMCHAHLMLKFPGILKPAQFATPGQHLSLLTHRLNSCLMCADASHYPPSILAVSLLSLELEHIRSDWFPLTLSLLQLINVTDFSKLISCREKLAFHLQTTSVTPSKQQASPRGRQQKRPAHSSSDTQTKRRVNDPTQPDTDDIYDSIKILLYGEENMEHSSTTSQAPVAPAHYMAALTPED